MTLKRIIANIILLLGILYAPWWATAALAALLAFYFTRYYELIVAGILIDMLYGNSTLFFIHTPYVFSVSAVLLYALIGFLKTKLRVYA